MTDVFPREVRSRIMSRIRSKSGLDRRLFEILDSLGVPYEKYPEAPGRPDARVGDVMVFAQGCFWHACKKHFRLPKSSFAGIDWRAKIAKNVERDRRVGRLLRGMGFKVLRVWEHDIVRNPERVRRMLAKAVAPDGGGRGGNL